MRASTKATAQEADEPVKPLHMLFEVSLIQEIDDYRYENRFPTRIEAVKDLIRFALEKKTKKR